MTAALSLLSAFAVQTAADYDDPSKEIQWARSFEQAYAEAEARNVPVLIWLTADT